MREGLERALEKVRNGSSFSSAWKRERNRTKGSAVDLTAGAMEDYMGSRICSVCIWRLSVTDTKAVQERRIVP